MSIKRAANVLAWLLAISFFFGAVTKFAPGETFFGPPYSEKFVEWGYPSWFRFIVGTGELIGGVLLVIPRFRFIGCLLLVLILEGALVTHIVNNDPLAESIAAPITLVLVVIVAVMSSPFELRRLATTKLEGSDARQLDADSREYRGSIYPRQQADRTRNSTRTRNERSDT